MNKKIQIILQKQYNSLTGLHQNVIKNEIFAIKAPRTLHF